MHTEIWKWQVHFRSKKHVVSSPNWIQLCKRAVACAIREKTSGFDLPPDAIGAVCLQSGLLSTDLHLISCADFVETFH